ncbi:hypothetical protein AXE80_00440 [Wenyingzhuangia fucanilytica]|uniref:DUF4890 domain-containing protein n=1 Tax=Wenyingzhuangia fucanilytica TaxID=1790137 RepID=A0A1B1Y257_9FLAO|nr:hypothetical protein [Wenyingzhuangia fucanilytica]ANW94853.1 hypothetical protein AXE80_00440 [Wenyingzhuangia fucanilytica]
MKKISLLIATFVFVGAFAQKNKPKKESFTAEQKTQLMVKKMSVALDLTEKQEAKITPIVADKVKKIEAKMAEFKDRKKGERPERKEISNEEKFKTAMAHLEEQKALQNKMKSILNKEQYVSWKEMQTKQHHRRGEMMKKRSEKKRGDSKGKRDHKREKPAA